MTDTRKIPTHEVTYARLRDMILFGLLEPGAPVTIQGLINDLGAGMTPVREALRRLAAEGALLPQVVFAFDQPLEVLQRRPAFLGGLGGHRLVVFGHVAEIEIAQMMRERRVHGVW